jgi:magnesium chelatase subunit D
MKLALLLAAVDWRLGVLLRGDKGSGKTTTARGLASLLPPPARFVNLPIGATEERLLGGLNIERTMKGEPLLKPGLLSEAHGGVLYIDEVNLLPAHLGDALLDAAASGIHLIEREGLSESHPAEFVLLGSMNPEEGSLRPQLLDRFALSVVVGAPLDPAERMAVMERRMSFERDPSRFMADWSAEEVTMRTTIANARQRLTNIRCSAEMLSHITSCVCERGVRSLRADLAVMRAAIACTALEGAETVEESHIATVLPLALAHRTRDNHPSTPSSQTQKPSAKTDHPSQDEIQKVTERIFSPRVVEAPALQHTDTVATGKESSAASGIRRGPVIGSRQSETPIELDVRATIIHSFRETGSVQPRMIDLHERVREPSTGTRYLFVIDSSGSHAVHERMRLVKGATVSLLTRSFRAGDETAIIVFRGSSAELVLEPTSSLEDAFASLEYLPTGGRTPLGHGLALAKSCVTPKTVLIVITDGRANFPLRGEDPWQDALEAASELSCPALVINTEISEYPLEQAKKLAAAMRARCVSLDELAALGDLTVELS